MRFGTAFKKALKYHAVASLPTFVGGAIAAVGLWIGLIEPALASVGGVTGGPQQFLQAVIAAPMNVPVLLGGVLGGLVVRRVGRTTLLFRIHGTGVVNAVEREVVPHRPAAERSASDEHSGESGSAEEAGNDEGKETADDGIDDDGDGADADAIDDDGDEADDDGIDDNGTDDEAAASSVESEPRTGR